MKTQESKADLNQEAGSEFAETCCSVDELTNHLNTAMDIAENLRDRRITGGQEWNMLTNVMWNISMAKLHTPNTERRHEHE